jgi:hypothetical protein
MLYASLLGCITVRIYNWLFVFTVAVYSAESLSQHDYPPNQHWPRVVGYGAFSLCVTHKEGLCPSIGLKQADNESSSSAHYSPLLDISLSNFSPSRSILGYSYPAPASRPAQIVTPPGLRASYIDRDAISTLDLVYPSDCRFYG